MLQVQCTHGVDVGTAEMLAAVHNTPSWQSRHEHSTCLGGGDNSGVAVVVLGAAVVVAGAFVVVLGTDMVVVGGGGLRGTGM